MRPPYPSPLPPSPPVPRSIIISPAHPACSIVNHMAIISFSLVNFFFFLSFVACGVLVGSRLHTGRLFAVFLRSIPRAFSGSEGVRYSRTQSKSVATRHHASASGVSTPHHTTPHYTSPYHSTPRAPLTRGVVGLYKTFWRFFLVLSFFFFLLLAFRRCCEIVPLPLLHSSYGLSSSTSPRNQLSYTPPNPPFTPPAGYTHSV